MATYVLVPGGGHGGWCYGRVARILTSTGHEVHCPTLTGIGERSHLLGRPIDLDTHITDVVNVLVYEDLHDVILIGHSYAGLVITGVADRASDRVGQLVYLDAPVPANGQSLAEMVPDYFEHVRRNVRVVDGVELALWPEDVPGNWGVTDPNDVAWLNERLTPHPWNCLEQPLRLADEAAVKRLPRTSINCPSTLQTLPAELVDAMLDADRVWEIDTGHDLMIIEPAAVAEMLLRLAEIGVVEALGRQ